MKAVMIRATLWAAVLATAPCLLAGDKDKDKTDKSDSKIVDSGTFGIYVAGKRIGTETFKIEQRPDLGIATAEVKVDDGTVKAVQTAEMQVTPKGELHSYIWRATSPTKEESSVEPSDQMLIEHIIPADLKKQDVPHALSASTVILDDNFFSQRELLFWRYLAAGCVPSKDGNRVCGTAKFIALVPRQHISVGATLSLVGMDKVNVKGTVRELTKVALLLGDPQQVIVMNSAKEAAPGQWFLWVNEEYKIIKIAVPESNVEVIRE